MNGLRPRPFAGPAATGHWSAVVPTRDESRCPRAPSVSNHGKREPDRRFCSGWGSVCYSAPPSGRRP
jgi:hypothetical protein